MTSKERIKKVLNFEMPDRIPVYDLIQSAKHKENILNFDIALLDDTNIKESDTEHKFNMLSCMDPFEDLSCVFGLEELLKDIAEDPLSIFIELKKSAYKTIRHMENLLDKNNDIDGIWLWSDMAYKDGMFFSEDFYRKNLFPLHKELCSFFDSKGLPVIIHSDGNLNNIIPDLIKAGFRGIHPVESSAGMDLEKLKDKYRKKIVFVGGFQLDLLKYENEEQIASILKRKLDKASEDSGYIFGFESPIGNDIDFDKYKIVLDMVRKYNSHQVTKSPGHK